MKAITLQKTGGVENLTYADIAIPSIRPDEVLIRVKAIGINPVDAFVRKNTQALQSILLPEKEEDTFILGWDISGTVEQVGTQVGQFRPGDDVFGMVNFKGQGRAYAEFLAAPASHLALKPANVSHDEAAAATLAALTAWQGLVTYAKVKPGDKVLIHAAAGGVGHYAVQIAKHFGAYVIGTASTANRDFVRGLGADECIDYTREAFEERVQDADIVFDSIYGDHLLRSLDAVKKGGRVISLLTFFEGAAAEKAREKEVSTHRLSVQSNGEDMEQIAQLLKEGSLRSAIFARYAFADLPQAHSQIETGKTQGKIVVTV